MPEPRQPGWLDGPLLAWSGLAAGIFASLVVWAGAAALADRRAMDELAQDARTAAASLDDALGRHVDLVGAAQALFGSAGRPVDRAQFHRYAGGLELRTAWPAVEALAFAPLVAGDVRSVFEAAVRTDRSVDAGGYAGFAIRPAGVRAEYLPITYAEPLGGNESLLGQDELADADRLAAARAARDSGRVLLLPPPARAVAEAAGPGPSTLPVTPPLITLIAAVYRTDGRLLGTDDRRIAHAGQLLAVVRLDRLVRAALGDPLLRSTAASLVDLGPAGRSTTARTIVPAIGAAEALAGQHATARIPAAGRVWELRLARAGVPGLWQGGSLVLLGAGIAGSFALFLFLRAFGDQRRAALRLASAMSSRVTEQERAYRVLVDQLREVVVRIDAAGVVTSLNPAWERLTGYRAADTLGRPLGDYVHPEDRDAAVATLAGLADGSVREASWTARFVARGNEVRWFESRWQVAHDAAGHVTGATGTLADVTDRTLAERDLRPGVQHDPLTGLPNRLLLEDRFAMALAQAMRDDSHLGVLMVDLEGFKHVNDACGRDVGDELLCAVAARLRGAVRGTDTVARVGADEFVVLLPGASHPEVTHRVASTIVSALDTEIPVGHHRVRVRPSVGVAAYPHDGDSLATLMASADAAMVRARSAGAGRVEVHAEVLGVGTAPSVPLPDARGSVARNEIAVRFAPQLDLASRRVVGAMLTLQWHGRTERASPSRFLPVSEDAGLIVPLGQWAMLTALRECHAWNARGDGLARVMFDVSVRELQQANFATAVERAIVRSDVDAADVWIAVESRAALRPSAAAAATLRDLAALGCVVGVADVDGAPLDYASVAADLPFRFVVVGRQRWTEGARRAELPFLQTARACGWTLVADEARTHAELDLAARLGFALAQGPAAGAPLTAEAIGQRFLQVAERDDRDAASAA